VCWGSGTDDIITTLQSMGLIKYWKGQVPFYLPKLLPCLALENLREIFYFQPALAIFYFHLALAAEKVMAVHMWGRTACLRLIFPVRGETCSAGRGNISPRPARSAANCSE
jgi:hypothetical protein